ncbi:hypothetical protein Pint_22288 [Pistacia integerrima]|uniref:Uncharacterized protein n=1 Tax=Pistacia integerrima TaxID=434235 RepID=A0ACC0YJZ4_9ROSI|nr:hypothetical protein Pint_22288 [Pistacia integerrima]
MAGLSGKVEKDFESIQIALTSILKPNLEQSECFHFPTASPSNIQGVEVHEGDWETGDSIKIWTYTVEGRAETFKEKVEADDEHMTITLHDIEGDIFKNFKFWNQSLKLHQSSKVAAAL